MSNRRSRKVSYYFPRWVWSTLFYGSILVFLIIGFSFGEEAMFMVTIPLGLFWGGVYMGYFEGTNGTWKDGYIDDKDL